MSKEISFYNKDIIEKANNYPLTKKDFIRSISKLNNTPYVIRNINLDIDNNIFIVVDTLPKIGKSNKIYLVPNNTGSFDEYFWNSRSFSRKFIK